MSRNYDSAIRLHMVWHAKLSRPLLTAAVQAVAHQGIRSLRAKPERAASPGRGVRKTGANRAGGGSSRSAGSPVNGAEERVTSPRVPAVNGGPKTANAASPVNGAEERVTWPRVPVVNRGPKVAPPGQELTPLANDCRPVRG